jgi:hypothetical protein
MSALGPNPSAASLTACIIIKEITRPRDLLVMECLLVLYSYGEIEHIRETGGDRGDLEDRRVLETFFGWS